MKFRPKLFVFFCLYITAGIYLVEVKDWHYFSHLYVKNNQPPSHEAFSEIIGAQYSDQEKMLVVCVEGKRLGNDDLEEYSLRFNLGSAGMKVGYYAYLTTEPAGHRPIRPVGGYFVDPETARKDCHTELPNDIQQIDVQLIYADQRFKVVDEETPVIFPGSADVQLPKVLKYQMYLSKYRYSNERQHFDWPQKNWSFSVYNPSVKDAVRHGVSGVYYPKIKYIPNDLARLLLYIADVVLAPVGMIFAFFGMLFMVFLLGGGH